MSSSSFDRPFFLPADTLAEAIERIYALTGRAPDKSPGGTRAGKRALVALRDSLDLQIDIVWTPAATADAIAEALSIEWHPEAFTDRHMVNLDGFNALLEGATEAVHAGSLHRLRDEAPNHLTGPGWKAFQPARSKIEAVTRIAALTNAPREWLGPGAKEHKSVFLHLANNLFPDDPRLDTRSKTKLGSSLAEILGVPWTDQCSSTGETIQLLGLNTILAGAERYLGRLGSEVADALATPEAEGDALAAALLDGLPDHWDGRRAVKWLADNQLRGANDNEWQGFYGEERAKVALASAFTPRVPSPVVRYGNTVFDYSLNCVWDIKVHTEYQVFGAGRRPGGTATLLNDEAATRACIEEQGLGFLVIGGEAVMDESGDFVAWHREFKAKNGGRRVAPSNSGNSRQRKSAFTPSQVEAFWVPNSEALDAAILGGRLKVRPIGRQPPKDAGGSGVARADKFEMRMPQARDGIRVARYDWQHRRRR